MNNSNEILFKCNANNSTKNIIEANKYTYSKKYKIYQIILVIILIIFFVGVVLSQMDQYDIFFIESAVMYFTNAIYLVGNMVIIFCIFKVAEIDCWFKTILGLILNRGDIPIEYCYVCFYESFYVFFTEIDSKIYSKVHVDYSTIDNYVITENMFLLNGNLANLALDKSSFTLGNIEQFNDFIKRKINVEMKK